MSKIVVDMYWMNTSNIDRGEHREQAKGRSQRGWEEGRERSPWGSGSSREEVQADNHLGTPDHDNHDTWNANESLFPFWFKIIVCVWFSMVLHTAKRSLALFSNVFSCSFLILGKRTEAGGQRMLPRLLCEEENNAKSPQIGHLTIHCRAQHGILVDRVLWQIMFRVFVSTIWSPQRSLLFHLFQVKYHVSQEFHSSSPHYSPNLAIL